MVIKQHATADSWRTFASQWRLVSPVDAVIAAILAGDLLQSRNPRAWTKEYIECLLDSEDISMLTDQAPPDQKSTSGIIAQWSADLRDSLASFLTAKLRNPYDLFAELLVSASDSDRVKALGAIYTPEWLATRLTRKVKGYWLRHHEAGRYGRNPSIIGDISCGLGVFLRKARDEFGTQPTIIGIDSDSQVIAFAELLQRATSSNYRLINTDTLLSTFRGETLLPTEDLALESFDLLLGNPPYVRSQQLNKEYSRQLKKRYSDVLAGNFDLSIAFLDRTLDLLAPGGIASYILTSKFMTSTYGKAIRTKLATTAQILNIEDFFDLQLFPGRTTYTCILTFAKLPPAKVMSVYFCKNKEA